MLNIHADAHKQTVLHLASGHNYGEIVRVLLSRGADPDARDENNRTALDEAARRRATDVVRVLHGTGTVNFSEQGIACAHRCA